ncbi:MAG: hypothetical protein IPM55_21380, partial [Acidobacteria bacterium]|nr:hypothetical protein [Acidobacteriota bacterium]
AGFDVRTYRLCRRVLMFHHFPEELGTPDYLVRSTAFSFSESPIASFITSVIQSGYVRREDGNHLKNPCRRSNLNTARRQFRKRFTRSMPKAWKICPTVWTVRTING